MSWLNIDNDPEDILECCPSVNVSLVVADLKTPVRTDSTDQMQPLSTVALAQDNITFARRSREWRHCD